MVSSCSLLKFKFRGSTLGERVPLLTENEVSSNLTLGASFSPSSILVLQLPCKHQNIVRFYGGAPSFYLRFA